MKNPLFVVPARPDISVSHGSPRHITRVIYETPTDSTAVEQYRWDHMETWRENGQTYGARVEEPAFTCHGTVYPSWASTGSEE